MITCYLGLVIDPYKLGDFQRYSRMIMPLAAEYGGTHHGTFFVTRGQTTWRRYSYSASRRWRTMNATGPRYCKTRLRWRAGASRRRRGVSSASREV